MSTNETTSTNSACNETAGGSSGLLCASTINSQQLEYALVLSCLGGFLVVMLFAVFRNIPSWKPIYHKRATQISDLLYRPLPLSYHGILNKLLSFFVPIFTTSDADLLRSAGMDSLAIVRVNLLGIHVMILLSVLGIPILIPIFLNGGELSQKGNQDEFMRFSMANIPRKGSALWAPTVLTVVFTGLCLIVMHLHFCSYAALKFLHTSFMDISGPQSIPGLDPMSLFAQEEFQDEQLWKRWWKRLLVWASPYHMYMEDVAFVRRCVKRYKETYENHFRNRSENNDFCVVKQKSEEDSLEAKNSGVSEFPKSICPWWLPPEQSPHSVNGAVHRYGVLLGKASPLLKDRYLGITETGVAFWVPVNLYVVLFRDAGKARKKFWYECGNVVRGLRLRKGDATESCDSVEEMVVEKEVSGKSRYEYLEQTLRRLYPRTFKSLVPAFYHWQIDDAIVSWDGKIAKIDRLKHELASILPKLHLHEGNDAKFMEYIGELDVNRLDSKSIGDDADALALKLENAMAVLDESMSEKDVEQGRLNNLSCRSRDSGRLKLFSKSKEKLSMLAQLWKEKAELEQSILALREEALANPCYNSAFAIFSDQRDALTASNGNIGNVPEINMLSSRAPGPAEVLYESLWSSVEQQRIQILLHLSSYVVVMIFPIGVLTGVLSNLTVAFCGGTPETNSWYWSGFCEPNLAFVRMLLTSILPVSISAFWDTYFMPIVLYLITNRLRVCESFTALDRAIMIQFFVYSVVNSFFFTVLGGATISQLGAAFNSGSFVSLLGDALPGASNYFLNYIAIHAAFTNWFRYFWPHDGTVLFAIFRMLGLASYPNSEREAWIVRSTPSFRSARHYGSFLMIFVVALSYSAIAPVILPLALFFFFSSWLAWRYNCIHFYQASYNANGHLFESFTTLFYATLTVANIFITCTLIAYGFYWQGGLMFAIDAAIITLARYYTNSTVTRFVDSVPLQMADSAPQVNIPEEVYMPAPMRVGAIGWYPEYGKAWEKYGLPRKVGPDPFAILQKQKKKKKT